MKAINKIKTSLKRIWHLCWLIPVFFVVSSCMQPTIFSVQFPQSGGTYIGNELVDFVINYNKSVTTADIYLNGVPIGTEFNYGPASAVGSVNNLKKYLKQGVNTLTVDPMAFGPTVKFVVDNAGPEIIVTYGKVTGTNVRVKGELRDASALSSLTVNVVKVTSIDQKTGKVTRSTGPAISIPIKSDGTFDKSNIDISGGVTIYTFTATDVHGQTSVKEFLADSNEIQAMAISNAMRMAIGDSFVGSLRPLIASALYSTLKSAPIDLRWKCWNNTLPTSPNTPAQNPFSTVGAFCTSGSPLLPPSETDSSYSVAERTGIPDGGTFNPGLNPVAVDIGLGPMDAWVKRLYMKTGATALLNNFKIQENNRLKVDMIITEMAVDLRITGSIKILFITIPLDLTIGLNIGRIVVDTVAVVQAINKEFDVQLEDSNFDLQNITTTNMCLTSPIAICLTGLVDAIMPILEGLIGDLLPGIINPILEDNLNKIVIGACMYPADNVTSVGCNNPDGTLVPGSSALFNWSINVETLKTDNLFGPGNPYDMIVGLETKFNLLQADANLFATHPTLGPVYVEDPIDVGLIYNSLGGTGNNLTVAISSNAINQGFSALYQSGYSHFSLVNGVMTYGADPTKPAGTKDQMRIRLYPEAPPVFTLNPVNGGTAGKSAARIGYESAVMYMDIHDGTAWKTQLELHVDFSIAANIAEVDNIVHLGVEGAPTFNLRKMVNNTGLPVTQSMLQGMVDVVFMYFVPELADQAFEINLANVADTSLNGSQVLFQSDADNLTQSAPVQGTGPDGKSTCSVTTTATTGDGVYDYVCETINFTINTNAVTSVGEKGTNLMFQMEARDPDLPAAPAIPRFDLDNDTVLDYKDNCSAPILMQVAAIKLAGGLVPANIDTNGNPTTTFLNTVLGHINRWVAKEQGVTKDSTGATISSGDYLKYLQTGVAADAGSGTPAAPDTTYAVTTYGGNSGNIAWWNEMRKGDNPVTALSSTAPWIHMIYSNTNQRNTDGDKFGELCENDNDRDYIYVDNGVPKDTCPTVKDPSNDSGSCTVDEAKFVLFKNKFNGLCMSHEQFKGTGDTGGSVDFSPGASTTGSRLIYKACNVDDLGQRFYVGLSSADGTRADRGVCIQDGVACKERIINIYTNEYKQTEPGFYDTVNHHYLSPTIANQSANGSSYWAYDDLIVTTMAGYRDTWRDWVLTPSNIADYPYLIESWRTWEVYTKRACIFRKGTSDVVDVDTSTETGPEGSCYPTDVTGRERAAFQVLLGPNQVKWSGAFSDQ